MSTNDTADPAPHPAVDGTAELLNTWVDEVQDYAIFLLDPAGNIASWNRGAERILGYTEAEIIGQPVAKFFTDQDVESGIADLELNTGLSRGRASDDRWHVRKNGSVFWCSGILTRLGDPTRGIRGFVKVMRDLTREKNLEQQLRNQTDQLLEADRRKNEFLAMLSHELRNPLSPIITSFYIIRDRVAFEDPIVLQSWATIERQFLHLRKLLDGLLDISRIALNKIELHKERVDLTDIIKRSVEDTSAQIEQTKHKLTISIPSEPIPVDGDPVRLGQVITNLLNNAIKFTDPGGSIELVSTRDGPEALIRVKDTGIGISSEMMGQIFDLFSQAEQGLDRSRGGLGVGLTLSRRLVELHGGTLNSHSLGQGLGSEFEIRLPMNLADPTPLSNEAPPILNTRADANLHVLIVDDNRDAAESLGLYLRQASHSVSIAHDGHSALELARTTEPDVVILDIGLPRLDGYEVARQIRSQSSIPLIALSGYAKDEGRDVDFDHYFVKPVKPGDLLALLSTLRPRAKPKAPSANPASA
jgi:PAS domain S-box-containing protein